VAMHVLLGLVYRSYASDAHVSAMPHGEAAHWSMANLQARRQAMA